MKRQERKPNGIYLDEPFTNALIVLGYNEGVIRSYTGGKSSYEKNFLSNFAKPALAKTALRNLVLYDKVYLCSKFDNFVVEDLQKEGVVDVPRLGFYYEFDPKFTEKYVVQKGLLYPALAYLKTAGKTVGAQRFLEILRNAQLADPQDLLMQMHDLEALKALGTHSSASDKQLEKIKQHLSTARPIFDALVEVQRLMDASSRLGVPALWNCPEPPFSKVIPNLKSDDTIIASIYFKNLRRVRVNSLSDAIELRRHPAIDEFRQEVLNMTAEIKTGALNAQRVIQRIARANRALELSELAGKIGNWITILGVPVLVVNPLVGGILTLTGASIVGAQFTARKAFNWALVSN
jgi:hypothetical protein